MRSIKVRMANRNSFQSALPLDKLDGGFIEVGDAVPEDVSVGRLQEDGALADAELFFFAEGWVERVVARVLRRDVVDARVVVVGRDGVLLGFLGGVEGGPGLACGRDVLAGVLRQRDVLIFIFIC